MQWAAVLQAMRNMEGEYESLWSGGGSKEWTRLMFESGPGPLVVISPCGVLIEWPLHSVACMWVEKVAM